MKTKTYYIAWSSIFDSAPYYQAELMRDLLRSAGIKKVRLCRFRGWSNQPHIVCFEGDGNEERVRQQIVEILSKAVPTIAHCGAIISERYW